MISNGQRNPLVSRLVWGGVTVGLLTVASLLTYLAGGTKTPIPHVFYVPIVVAAVVFGFRGTLAAAVAAGVLCGPLMPLDVATGQAQATSSWLIRLGFFAGIGLVVAIGCKRLTRLRGARQDFLSVVSHELRTPVASILGFAALLTDDSDHLDEHERREFAEIIFKEATELSNVVDHYVVEGRLEDSALFIESSPTDIRRVTEIVLDGLPPDITGERITVDGSSVICIADPLRVRQIVRSMVNNALAYTTETLVISIAAHKTMGEVRITDQGPVSPAQRNILGPLGQLMSYPLNTIAARPVQTVITPLGIGLAVSRDLARRMGGELHYEVNEYTEITLQLPLQR